MPHRKSYGVIEPQAAKPCKLVGCVWISEPTHDHLVLLAGPRSGRFFRPTRTTIVIHDNQAGDLLPCDGIQSRTPTSTAWHPGACTGALDLRRSAAVRWHERTSTTCHARVPMHCQPSMTIATALSQLGTKRFCGKRMEPTWCGLDEEGLTPCDQAHREVYSRTSSTYSPASKGLTKLLARLLNSIARNKPRTLAAPGWVDTHSGSGLTSKMKLSPTTTPSTVQTHRRSIHRSAKPRGRTVLTCNELLRPPHPLMRPANTRIVFRGSRRLLTASHDDPIDDGSTVMKNSKT